MLRARSKLGMDHLIECLVKETALGSIADSEYHSDTNLALMLAGTLMEEQMALQFVGSKLAVVAVF